MPKEYYYQVHSQILICDKAYCDFFAYHPNLENLIIRINRDDKVCKEIEKKIKESILKVKDILKQLNK